MNQNELKKLIVQYPNEILKMKSEKILGIGQLADILNAMREFVLDDNNKACGLALPQLGISERAFVAQVSAKIKGKVRNVTEIFINPEIRILNRKTLNKREGCLSMEGLNVMVSRPKKISISYTNIKGVRCFMELEDWDARVVLHENDHLNGVLITDIGTIIESEELAVIS